MANKAILLIMDGLGDLPSPAKTPLQAAKTPNMDGLAKKGLQGLMSTLGLGVVPGSDTAHLQILGYPPADYYCGRGPLEALGAGIPARAGDVAFRANFATQKGNEIIDRRAGRPASAEVKALEKEANFRIDDVDVIFRATVEHRGALVLRGKGLSAAISPTDSHKTGPLEAAKPLDRSAEARKTAYIINKFTKSVREKLGKSQINAERAARGLPQANAIVLRGAGMCCEVPGFGSRFGASGACVAGGALYKGVAKYVGLDVLEVPGATGTYATDLAAKGKAAQKALANHDFVFVHVKATDSFSHDGDAKGKAAFIERVDRELVPLLEKTGAAIVITGDHSTACVRRDHTGYEVPILVFEEGGRSDGLGKFDEIAAMAGGLGHISGRDVMPMILNIIGKGKMQGS